MKKRLLLLLFLPVLAFGEVNLYDWYRVEKDFHVPRNFEPHFGDLIYVGHFRPELQKHPFYPRLWIFRANGEVEGYFRVDVRGMRKLQDPEYCTFLENREDKRYK